MLSWEAGWRIPQRHLWSSSPPDVSRALSAAQARRTDSLLSRASRVVRQPTNGWPSQSSNLLFRGYRVEPYANSSARQLLHGGCSNFGTSTSSPLCISSINPAPPAPAFEVQKQPTTHNPPIHTPPEVGACLASFVSRWEAINALPSVISFVSGVRLEFKSPRSYACIRYCWQSSSAQMRVAAKGGY